MNSRVRRIHVVLLAVAALCLGESVISWAYWARLSSTGVYDESFVIGLLLLRALSGGALVGVCLAAIAGWQLIALSLSKALAGQLGLVMTTYVVAWFLFSTVTGFLSISLVILLLLMLCGHATLMSARTIAALSALLGVLGAAPPTPAVTTGGWRTPWRAGWWRGQGMGLRVGGVGGFAAMLEESADGGTGYVLAGGLAHRQVIVIGRLRNALIGFLIVDTLSRTIGSLEVTDSAPWIADCAQAIGRISLWAVVWYLLRPRANLADTPLFSPSGYTGGGLLASLLEEEATVLQAAARARNRGGEDNTLLVIGPDAVLGPSGKWEGGVSILEEE